MLLCFDFDGVIVDSLQHHLRATIKAQAELGCGRIPTLADFETVEDLSYDGFARHLQIPQSDWARWKERVLLHLQSDAEPAVAFPDIVQVVSELGSRFPIVVITSNIRKIVEDSLHRLSLSAAVEEIYDGRARGSKGDKIKQASERAGIPLASTYMIGDTRGDIRHAKAAGAKAIATCWGFQSRAVLDLEKPDAFAKIPRDLLAFFGVLEVH